MKVVSFITRVPFQRQHAAVRIGCATKLPALLLLLNMPAVVQGQFLYTTNDGTVTITGYTGPGGAVTIPSTTNGWPVTSIGVRAFSGCWSLTSVTIPNSVTSIGDYAFYWCFSPASVTIGKGVTNIGHDAFLGCTSLTNVTIGTNVTNIGASAFFYCTSLTGVYFQGNAPTVNGSSAFWGDNKATVHHLAGSTGWARPLVVFRLCCGGPALARPITARSPSRDTPVQAVR